MQAFTVLIVEDEILVALMLEEAFSEAGFRTVGVCRSSGAALDHLRKSAPDIMMIDLVLQGDSSGLDLARSVRRIWPGPIVFHTSVSDSTLRDEMSSIPNSAVVLKPAGAGELIRTMRALLGLSSRR